MKKTLVSLTAGFLIAGTAVTSVSAQEYKIQEGDTLGNIADNYSTTVGNLKDINNLDTDIIYPGQKLSINDNQNQAQYKVKKGDTLGGIGQEFGVTVNDLKAWNNLNSDLIITDQTLNVQNVAPSNNEAVVEDQTNAGNQTDGNTEEVVQEDENQETDASDDQPAVQEEAAKEDNQQANNQEASDDQVEADNQEPSDVQEDTDNQEASDNQENIDNQKASENKSEDNQEDSNNQADTSNQSNDESQSDDATDGKTIQVSSTAYTADCEGCSGQTATGIDLGENPDEKVIAVDPSVIPLGSKVHVEGYGDAIAADTGGAINGKKIDVHVPNEDAANAWGVQDVDVTILD